MGKELTRISDIYMNAYLRSGGYRAIDTIIETIDGRRTVIFLYDEDEDIENAIQSFRDSEFMRKFIREYLYSKRAVTTALNNK